MPTPRLHLPTLLPTLFVLAISGLFCLPAAAVNAAGERCIYCPKPLDTKAGVRYAEVQGRTHYWHPAHGTRYRTCATCGGMMAPYAPSGAETRTRAGIAVCGACASTAVGDVATAMAIAADARSRMESWGMTFNWGQIPVSLAQKNELVKLNHHPGVQTLGETQTQHLIAPGGQRTLKTLRIRMLDGLPRLLFERTVAHELMHAWMNLASCPVDQDPAFREGACNLAAYFYLQSLGTPGANFLRHQMMVSPDPIYGEGLRKHVKLAERLRVSGVLALLPTHKNFPR